MRTTYPKILVTLPILMSISLCVSAQAPDYDIVNNTDCTVEVKVHLYPNNGPGCATSGGAIDNTGWISVSAQSTRTVTGGTYPVGHWNRAEMKNPDFGFPPNCAGALDVTEEAGPSSTHSDDGTSCECADIKITTDNCDKATIEPE